MNTEDKLPADEEPFQLFGGFGEILGSGPINPIHFAPIFASWVEKSLLVAASLKGFLRQTSAKMVSKEGGFQRGEAFEEGLI